MLHACQNSELGSHLFFHLATCSGTPACTLHKREKKHMKLQGMEGFEGQFLSNLQLISQSCEKERNLCTFSATLNAIFRYEDFKRGSHTRSFVLNLFLNGVAIIFRKKARLITELLRRTVGSAVMWTLAPHLHCGSGSNTVFVMCGEMMLLLSSLLRRLFFRFLL